MATRQESSFTGTSTSSPQPSADVANIATVGAITSLTSEGNQPSLLSNLAYSHIVQVQNGSAQNAIANQRSHSQVAVAVLGKSVNAVQNLTPSQTRAAVDVLTGSEPASQLTALQSMLAAFTKQPSGGGGSKSEFGLLQQLLATLRVVSDDLKKVFERNEELQGSGTPEDPFESKALLYVEPPVALVFAGVSPQDLNLAVDKDQVRAR